MSVFFIAVSNGDCIQCTQENGSCYVNNMDIIDNIFSVSIYVFNDNLSIVGIR